MSDINVQVKGAQDTIANLEKYKNVVLKPNVDATSNKNILVQGMINEAGVKYVIRWNYDLNGQTITIPENCILSFEGGSFTNGTLNGQDTYIDYIGNINDVLNVTRIGTFSVNGVDFLNVNDINEQSSAYASSALARQAVPVEFRKLGLQITYLLANGWHTEQFIGSSISDWGVENNWNNFVQNDKAYDSLTASGLGRKFLRKNIVNGVNTLTQAMINDANTIYHIQYDYTLAANITIPANCVLLFEGGSISGAYTLTGNDTNIIADLVKIFGTELNFSGTWNVPVAYPEWLSCKVNDSSSVCAAIAANKLFDISRDVYFQGWGIYYANSGTTLKVRGKIRGKARGRSYNNGTVGTYIKFSNISTGQSCVLLGVSGGNVSDREKSLYITDLTIQVQGEGKTQTSAIEIGAVSGAYLTDVYVLNMNYRASEFSSPVLSDVVNLCNYGVKTNGDSEFVEILDASFEGDIPLYGVAPVDFLNVTNVSFVCGAYGFASIAGILGSAVHFRNISMNQGVYGIYNTNASNTVLFDGFRIEQLRDLEINSKHISTNIYIEGEGSQPIPVQFIMNNGHFASYSGITIKGLSYNSYTVNRFVFRNITGVFNATDTDKFHFVDTTLAPYVELVFENCNIYGFKTMNLAPNQFADGFIIKQQTGSIPPMLKDVEIHYTQNLSELINEGYIEDGPHRLVKKTIDEINYLDVSETSSSSTNCKQANFKDDESNNTVYAYLIEAIAYGHNVYGKCTLLHKYPVNAQGIINSDGGDTELISKEGDDIFSYEHTAGKIAYRGYSNSGTAFFNHIQEGIVLETKVTMLR